MYQRVKKDQIEHGERFDMEFWHCYIDKISKKIESKEKRKNELVFPPEVNNL